MKNENIFVVFWKGRTYEHNLDTLLTFWSGAERSKALIIVALVVMKMKRWQPPSISGISEISFTSPTHPSMPPPAAPLNFYGRFGNQNTFTK